MALRAVFGGSGAACRAGVDRYEPVHLRRTLQQPVPAPPVTGEPFHIHHDNAGRTGLHPHEAAAGRPCTTHRRTYLDPVDAAHQEEALRAGYVAVLPVTTVRDAFVSCAKGGWLGNARVLVGATSSPAASATSPPNLTPFFWRDWSNFLRAPRAPSTPSNRGSI